MLLRAYRVTDKVGIIIFKTSAAIVDATLEGLSLIWGAVRVVLRLLLRLFLLLVTPLVMLGSLVFRGSTGTGKRTAGNMARRASSVPADAAVREDPLKVQNRALNGLTITLLIALLGVIIWATSPSRGGSGVPLAPSGDGLNAELFAAETPSGSTPAPGANLLASPVPTATPIPSVLAARGAIAYTVRENAQTDIWVVAVDGRTPIRITNSVGDERDPVWSPDGRRIAYAGNVPSESGGGNWEIYILDVIANTTTRLTRDLSFQGAPQWSPDGEYIVYESYQGSNLDIYVMRADGSEPPIRLPSSSDAPDFSPSWSPDGRSVAFVSWRDGNQDIYLFSLDDQSVSNVTNTPGRSEDFPAWNPDGRTLAYSALDEGLEKVFVVTSGERDSAQVIGRGRAPAWSPDGQAVIAAVDTIDGTQLVAIPFGGVGVITPVLQVQAGSSSPSWTSTPLPPALINGGGLPPAIEGALYVEQERRLLVDPPYQLAAINVTVDQPSLSDRVNDSFNALRLAANDHAGWDVLGRLDDAFWEIDRPPSPGELIRSWFKTGRAFGLIRADIIGNPPALEIVREDIGVETYWRVYVRVAEEFQSGLLGEPLRSMPWDFESRTTGDVEAYDQGGRLKNEMPSGYYIDLTQLAQDYGWMRMPVGSDWRANINSVNYWLFVKADGLSWYDAMRELYAEGVLINFAPTPTPMPAGT